MAKFENLTGQKFGRLTVIKKVPAPKHVKEKAKVYWLCKCDCGSEKEVMVITQSLKAGKTKSCGCLQKESMVNFNKRNKKKYNTYDLSGEYGIGWTSNTNEEFYFDLEDYDKIKDYCWRKKSDKGYIQTSLIKNNSKNKIILIHRLILNCLNSELEVDHINHNTLDNRKHNLRLCNNTQNQMNKNIPKNNKSGVIGVCWKSREQKWVAQININQKVKWLGYFDDFEDAVKVRKEAEIKYYGEYLNKNL